jgi:hypothetical protein
LRNVGPGELWMFVFELSVRSRGDHPSH